MNLKNIIRSRYGGMVVSSLVFLLVSFIVRALLFVMSIKDIEASVARVAGIFIVGFFFDMVVLLYLNTIRSFFDLFVKDKFFESKFNRINSMIQYFIYIFVILFICVAELFFWDEFTARFNFIAVDYLVYTQEVLDNIWQSYSIVWIITIILALSGLVFWATYKAYSAGFSAISTFRKRLTVFAILAILSCLSLFADNSMADFSQNRIANELSRNGIYSFFSAFRNSVLSYDDFYITIDTQDAFKELRKEYGLNSNDPLSPDEFSIERVINGNGRKKNMNVVMIVVESLSAKFMGFFGNTQGLTPQLDALMAQSLTFSNFYATGTRTTRGLEAIALSVPPTPGRSVVKRPDNHDLFNLGKVLNEKGYETEFLYGGRGFFDNMNSFFSGNGFMLFDQTDFPKEHIHFANAWGVCDGDLFSKTLQECDRTYSCGKPFFKLIMTTSNHRPYTHPDIAGIPASGRDGAVKYTDYAIGQFVKEAKSKAWFDNTVFVVVADHYASSAGKLDIEIDKYHIPLIIYAPSIVTGGRVIDTLSSQIDIAPTLLGLLDCSYTSRFYGKDILSDPPKRAFIANYQKIGYYSDDMFYVLLPGKRYEAYTLQNGQHETPVVVGQDRLKETIVFYQTASYLIKNYNKPAPQKAQSVALKISALD